MNYIDVTRYVVAGIVFVIALIYSSKIYKQHPLVDKNQIILTLFYWMLFLVLIGLHVSVFITFD